MAAIQRRIQLKRVQEQRAQTPHRNLLESCSADVRRLLYPYITTLLSLILDMHCIHNRVHFLKVTFFLVPLSKKNVGPHVL